jgi:hypothetical protein
MPPQICARLLDAAIELREFRMQQGQRQPTVKSVDSDVRTEFEPDPMLRLSEGKATPIQILLVGLVGIAIIGTVAWAMLNGG